MSRRILFAAAVAFATASSLWAWTDYAIVGGCRCEYVVEDGEATITGNWSADKPTGDVTIPSSLGGCPVTGIGEWAFETCDGLTGVEVPESVRHIGGYAFQGCRSLASVTLGAGVTDIGDFAFLDCGALVDVTLPDSLRNIGERAFMSCGLTSVTIPRGVKNIGAAPFAGCKGLTSISVDEGNFYYIAVDGLLLTRGGDTIVQGVNRDIAIPENLGCTGEGACELQVLGVMSIGEGAFSLLDRITDITIPAGVTRIGADAFTGCSGLKAINVATNNPSFKSASGLLLTKDGKKLVAAPGGVEEATIPDGVETIGEGAFKECSSLVRVAIPDGVKTIGERAFCLCTDLAGITMPSSVTSIGDYAFMGCGRLASVTIPSGVTSIGDCAFALCTSLRQARVPRTLEGHVPDSAFIACAPAFRIVYYEGPQPLSVVVADGQESMGRTTGGNASFTAGAKVPLKATANRGYVFSCWRRTVAGPPYAADSGELLSQAPSFNYVASGLEETIVAVFATVEDDAASLKVNVADGTTAADGTYALDLGACVESLSQPKLTVKGLPPGLKYDAGTMTVSGTATKPGTYNVTVTATNASATGKDAVTQTFAITVPNLSCDALPNLLPETDAYGTILCGVAFDPDLVDGAPEEGWTVKAAGLPAGLAYDAKTGAITGVPTKAGTYTVTFTASKKGEKNQIATITLTTEALPDWAQGAFAGYVKEGADYGSATMTVAANGKVSGKFTLSGTNWTFAAASYASVECPSPDVDEATFSVNAEAKADKATMAVAIAVCSANGPAAGGTQLENGVAEGTAGGCEVTLWRNMWKDKSTSAAAKAVLAGWEGAYTLSAEDGGYLSITVGKNGDVKASGKLSDGTAVSATVPLMYEDGKDFFTVVCVSPSAYKGGCVWLPVGFGTERGRLGDLGERLVVRSRNPQATGEYGAGLSLSLSFEGAYYDKTKNLSDYYESLRFSADQPTLDGAAPQNGDAVEVAINAKGKPVIDKATGLTLTFTSATGVFKGSYTFIFGEKTKKKVSFEGVLVQGSDTLRGFYPWDASASYADPKTGKEKTYKYKESHVVSLSAP